ncbi:MAG: hypothetical protein ACD_33C00026G0005, partial [uncultured bacterium]
MTKKFTQEEFIRRAIAIHGNKYGHGKVVYINNSTKIILDCYDHGPFEQIPSSHLSGHGCLFCSMEEKKLTREEFIAKAKLIHGNKFDYSKVIYINSYTKVIIRCPIHGDFEQKPNDHLQGQGCSKCKYEKISVINSSNVKEFIEKAIAVHGNNCDYSKVNYINACTKVIIICPIHGEFLQTPNSHLTGNGCPKCHFDKLSKIHTSNTKDFIEKARKIHGYRFGYRNANYINSWTKVFLDCDKHGEFEQTPNAHLSGHGCPMCNSSKGEVAISHILHKYNINFTQEYRIPEITDELYYDFYLPDY